MNKSIFNLLIIIYLSTTLSACQQQLKERANDIGQRMGWVKTPQTQWIEGSNYYNFPEFSPGKQYKPESTFCYKVQTDILCYEQPRKGWEDRMVGYQEPLRPKQSWPDYKSKGYYYEQPNVAMNNGVSSSDNYDMQSAPSSSTPFSAPAAGGSSSGISTTNLPPLTQVTVQ
jgi:hypothetical protein